MFSVAGHNIVLEQGSERSLAFPEYPGIDKLCDISQKINSSWFIVVAFTWWRLHVHVLYGEAVILCYFQKVFSLLSLSVSSPRLLPALCQCFDFCQRWPGPFSYLLSFQLCSV